MTYGERASNHPNRVEETLESYKSDSTNYGSMVARRMEWSMALGTARALIYAVLAVAAAIDGRNQS